MLQKTQPIVISLQHPISMTVGQIMRVEKSITLSHASSNWLSFNSSTGVLSGTPTNSHIEKHTVKLSVSDSSSVVYRDFTINVSNVNDAPTISSSANTLAIPGEGYSYTLKANDVDVGDLLTMSAPPYLPGYHLIHQLAFYQERQQSSMDPIISFSGLPIRMGASQSKALVYLLNLKIS